MNDQQTFRPQHLIGYLKRAARAAHEFTKSYRQLQEDESTRGAAVVCLALAVELHLKFLRCARDGEHLQTHTISKLFASLSAEDQRELRGRIVELWADNNSKGGEPVEATFDNALPELDKTFVQWRYAHEALDGDETLSMSSEFALHLIEAIQSRPIYVARKPQEHTDADVELFISQVLAGGRIDRLDSARVRQSSRLVYLFHETHLIGVSAIKIPDLKYRTSIFFKAESLLDPALFDYEFGYVAIDKSHAGKGYGKAVSEQALAAVADKPVYATVHEDNEPMHRILRSHGFMLEGIPYKNAKNRVLCLFVKNL